MDTNAGPRTAELALGSSGGMEASGGFRSWLPPSTLSKGFLHVFLEIPKGLASKPTFVAGDFARENK